AREAGEGPPQPRPCRRGRRRRLLAKGRVLRSLPGPQGGPRLWRPPQRNAFHQRTAALRHLPRLACRGPDDLFRQDHVLEREPRGAPGLGHEAAAAMIADAAPARRAFAEERTPAHGHVGRPRFFWTSPPPTQ